jgi:hypothetical protein
MAVSHKINKYGWLYYQYFCSKQPTDTLKSWSEYLDALTKVQKGGASPSPSDKTLAGLKQMKDDYRNPIAHPRITLTEIDARMLFDNGESFILGMSQESREAQKAAQPTLALVLPATGTP